MTDTPFKYGKFCEKIRAFFKIATYKLRVKKGKNLGEEISNKNVHTL